jgi:tetratricopeptide (TPR) repeat protein
VALLARPVYGDETGPLSAEELIRRGHNDLASGHWNAAESLFRKAVEIDPTNSTAYAGLGYALAGLHHPAEAAEAYERAVELNPLRTNTWLYLAGTYYSLGRYAKAADAYREYISLNPRDDKPDSTAYAWTWLGASLDGLHRYQEANTAYEKSVELNPQATNVWWYLGWNYYALGNYEKSVDAYQRYVSLRPGTDRGYYGLYCSLSKLERFNEAERAARQAVTINPTNAMYLAEWGYSLEMLGRHDEAAKTLEKALTLRPKHAETCLRLGVAYYREKAYPQAITALQRCISIEPTNYYGICYLGYSYYELGRYGDAARVLQEATTIRPEKFEAHEWYGFSLFRLGRFDDATASFEKVYEIKKDKTIRRALFCCYLLSSQYEKANQLYPAVFTYGGSALFLAYVIGFMVLFHFSLKVSSQPFPSLRFSFGWLALFFEGQIAFIFCLGLLSLINISENILLGITLAGIPVIFAAGKAFTRQPWGQPFSWPLRLGTVKVIGLSLLGLVLALSFGSWSVKWIAQFLHRPMPVQETIPLIKYALSANPVAAFFSIVIVGPMAEEILFRGLMYGALEKRLHVAGAILMSSLVFALAHLQVVHILPIFCLGIALGWARWKSGSLGLPILLHVLNNGVALLLLRFFEKS